MNEPPLSSMRHTSSLPTQTCTWGRLEAVFLGVDDKAELAFHRYGRHMKPLGEWVFAACSPQVYSIIQRHIRSILPGCEVAVCYSTRYGHHNPSVSTLRSNRIRFALANSRRASVRASSRHRRWSSLRDASRGSVSGGRVRWKSLSMAISNPHRRTDAPARSIRLRPDPTPTRNSRHSATNGAAGPKASSSSGWGLQGDHPNIGQPRPSPRRSPLSLVVTSANWFTLAPRSFPFLHPVPTSLQWLAQGPLRLDHLLQLAVLHLQRRNPPGQCFHCRLRLAVTVNSRPVLVPTGFPLIPELLQGLPHSAGHPTGVMAVRHGAVVHT